MSHPSEAEHNKALEKIRRILNDDANYQYPSLKLGAIWDVVDRVARYRRGQDVDGQAFVEVMDVLIRLDTGQPS